MDFDVPFPAFTGLGSTLVRCRTFLLCVVLSTLLMAPGAAGPFEDGWAAALRRDYTTAYYFWRPLAEQGDAIAQFLVGEMYLSGAGVEQDDVEALRWLRRAADKNDADAQFEVGAMYHNGRGKERNVYEAVRWYRLAAENGEARAQTNLGAMYDEGEGVPQDYSAAMRWSAWRPSGE